MKEELRLIVDPKVSEKFDAYPLEVRPKMLALRDLVLETAADLPSVNQLEETLKWGEPSYIAPKGSTLRMDWKEKNPNHYALYFKCTSKLIPTIKEIFGNTFSYEKDRAILLNMDEKLPQKALKTCIGFALRYHELKSKPLLGYKKE
jgi:hypothetical protein